MEPRGSVIGASLLIAGSCIGVGMLALPILSGLAGFYPSFALFILAALFMTTTALLLVEVSSWFDRPVSFITMVESTLGKMAKGIYWIIYLSLFYALLVAYAVGSGNHVAAMVPIPDSLGSFFFVVVFGSLIYFGTRTVDLTNRVLMVGKIGAYALIILFGMRFVSEKNLQFTDHSYILASLPILIISFGFHNMIPSIFGYLQRDVRRTRQAIFLGVGFTFVLYVLWQIVALGTLPHQVVNMSLTQDVDAAEALMKFLKTSWVGQAAQVMAFFAILTSFLAQGLSLVHFLKDGFKMEEKKRENPYLCALALVPPLAFSMLFPGAFFKALNFAGGICAVLLFGIFPVLMAWVGRYRKAHLNEHCLRGGKGLLISIFAFAMFVFIYQIVAMAGR